MRNGKVVIGILLSLILGALMLQGVLNNPKIIPFQKPLDGVVFVPEGDSLEFFLSSHLQDTDSIASGDGLQFENVSEEAASMGVESLYPEAVYFCGTSEALMMTKSPLLVEATLDIFENVAPGSQEDYLFMQELEYHGVPTLVTVYFTFETTSVVGPNGDMYKDAKGLWADIYGKKVCTQMRVVRFEVTKNALDELHIGVVGIASDIRVPFLVPAPAFIP